MLFSSMLSLLIGYQSLAYSMILTTKMKIAVLKNNSIGEINLYLKKITQELAEIGYIF